MTVPMTRPAMLRQIMQGIDNSVIERILNLGGLQQVMKNELEFIDRWEDERYIKDMFSPIILDMAGGLDTLQVVRDPDEEVIDENTPAPYGD